MIPIIIDVVNILFWIVYILLFARIILSWFPMQDRRIMDLVFALTEPILAPIRALVSRSPLGGQGMMIDFTPLIAFILIRLVSSFLISFLWTLA